MKVLFTHILFWGIVSVAGAGLQYFFSRLVGLPMGLMITVGLVVTWLVPRPWRFVLPLAIAGELVAITPPLAVTFALFSPLLLFWLRGRIEADISFSYLIMVGASAALALALVVGPSVYPHWMDLPWLIILRGWVAITLLAMGVSILLPSLHSRFLHGRYF